MVKQGFADVNTSLNAGQHGMDVFVNGAHLNFIKYVCYIFIIYFFQIIWHLPLFILLFHISLIL